MTRDRTKESQAVLASKLISEKSISSKPLPRFRRSTEAPPLVVQERDIALLFDLWRYRCLTTSQLQTLRSCDPDCDLRFVSRLTLTRRLKLLFHNHYVRRLARPCVGGMLEPVYLLDREGAKVLSRLHGSVAIRPPSQQPRLAALDHLLAINEFRVCLTAACARTSGCARTATSKNPIHLQEWRGSEGCKFTVSVAASGHHSVARPVKLLPDGFFRLRESGTLFYFLEVDLGSEVSRTLTEKCLAYYAFWQSGGFARQYAVSPKAGFRVLFVAPTPKRAATILSAIKRMQVGQSLFWVALQRDITPLDMLRPIYQSVAQANQRFNLLGHSTTFT